jgi:hypothetical protein
VRMRTQTLVDGLTTTTVTNNIPTQRNGETGAGMHARPPPLLLSPHLEPSQKARERTSFDDDVLNALACVSLYKFALISILTTSYDRYDIDPKWCPALLAVYSQTSFPYPLMVPLLVVSNHHILPQTSPYPHYIHR